MQVVIALIVTPEGFPLAYEVLPGNTTDKTTLRSFMEKIEAQYGKARRVWVMDRGIPTEEVLQEMRSAEEPAVQYLVGTPKGRLGKLESELLKLGAAKSEAGRDWSLLDLTLPERPTKKTQRRERTDFSFQLDKERLRIARRREGRYLLRSKLLRAASRRSPLDGAACGWLPRPSAAKRTSWRAFWPTASTSLHIALREKLRRHAPPG